MSEEQVQAPSRHALPVRLAIGLAQGIALYGLAQAHGRLIPFALGSLQYLAWLAPIVALGAYGATRPRVLLTWVATASLIAAGLGGYEAFVKDGQPGGAWGAPPVAIFVASALFILHHLILPAPR